MNQQQTQLFATDLDGTLLGDDQPLATFRRLWQRLEDGRRPLLVYNSGRLQNDTLGLIERGLLPAPDYLISGVGTQIYDYRRQKVVKAFADVLDEGWDREAVERLIDEAPYAAERQPAHYQNGYKSSWYLDDAGASEIDDIRSRLDDAGLETHVVYSSGRHLDILPKWANKGNALRWLLRHLDIEAESVVVAGDSGNDSAMFTIKGVRGIVVGNAQPELLKVTRPLASYHAPQHAVCAQALIGGLHHYGVFDGELEADADESEQQALVESLRHSTDAVIEGLSADQLSFIRLGYHKAIEALKKNITPLGFSACSLDDNESLGTDVNYRSVWARDGAITVIGSLPLRTQDEALATCQKQTLLTLLQHVSPTGLVPANVRIDDETPDYSGVGGIASIDSGLWLIIACYTYAEHAGDLDFLREQIGKLQLIMDWLSAHDSNNDALLEIPEAGDWTDLFGRSYNVLYDEVLWYRCNVCFGRILETLGDEQRAGDYLRWAGVIRREIVSNFWPTTQQRSYQSISFADQQFSLGDARYLIAQITPFDFNWRCDSFGNLLAFLYDVVDAQQAGQTFRFLWGVGVNEPYPIANLYPAVSAGDKDWRAYYAVNLLNLPHHYHNGGIWPFVGGHWVRFVNKLGLRSLALTELHRLAELNKLGVLNAWEFNEWAHGLTGRPMGKAYQAWSAAEFIAACHALKVIA